MDTNWNTGDCNTGDCNTGDCNTGDRNTGIFNTDEPNARMFNKDTGIKMSEFITSNRYPELDGWELTVWLDETMMTEEEKTQNPTYKTTGGYLKSFEYKEAWAIFWSKTSEDNKQKFLNLPNFDAKIFEEVTGINVDTKSLSGKKVKVELDGISYTATID